MEKEGTWTRITKDISNRDPIIHELDYCSIADATA